MNSRFMGEKYLIFLKAFFLHIFPYTQDGIIIKTGVFIWPFFPLVSVRYSVLDSQPYEYQISFKFLDNFTKFIESNRVIDYLNLINFLEEVPLWRQKQIINSRNLIRNCQVKSLFHTRKWTVAKRQPQFNNLITIIALKEINLVIGWHNTITNQWSECTLVISCKDLRV